VALSFIFFRKKFADMDRPYKVKNAKLIGFLAVAVGLFFAYLYMPIGPSSLVLIEWVFVLVWFVLFALLSLWCKLTYRDVDNEERLRILLND